MCHHLMAQIPITNTKNNMRSGDVLRRIEINYVFGGEAGQNKVWTLGRISEEDKDLFQAIMANEDTIAVFEKGIIKHYIMHGDTLCFKGNQQRHSFLIYEHERPVLCFPFAFGDSISGNYTAKGLDDNIDLFVNGWGYSVADGTGVLRNSEHTINHISRIHLFDDYFENHGNQVELHIRSNRFLWYCDGYRYPVMESVRRVIIGDNAEETPLDSVTYLYLPVQQSDLAIDEANDSILWNLAKSNGETITTDGSFGKSLSYVQAELSADGHSINVSYSLLDNSELRIAAYDIMGSQLGLSYYKNKEVGEWQECITLKRKPISNILMLKINCNEETTTIKVNEKK